ncbi:uncharacterized protein LOC112589716 [Harpegnathos saltator]|uniref:uncharacterized protein LOC112589716 n=1 Tax=Harpegnathos saltator TaxID=610380 RepID=UPI000DBEE4F4|nr:uncharacterized protein LOC112589716 [Harpegnathos saltator]
MSGFVERKLLKKITCETCLYLFNECTVMKSTFIERKSCGYLHYPREDTYKLIVAADKVFNFYKLQNNLYKKNACQEIIIKTIRNIDMDKILMNYEGKLMSQNIEYIRHQFTKIILFKGMKSAMIVLIMAVFGTGGAADVYRCPKSLLAVHSYIVKGRKREQ